MPRTSSDSLVTLTKKFSHQINKLMFSPPLSYIYNPLEYAWEPHAAYLRNYGSGKKRTIFIGMNPGPWGMVQTGIPFGEITLVTEWLGLKGRVAQPAVLHPKRPVEGFACTRHEVSGRRLWGLMRDRFRTPRAFFAEHFVANYCPLALFDEQGKNITPDKLQKADREPLLALCNQYLLDTLTLLAPRYVIGVGRFAEKQIVAALKQSAVSSPSAGARGASVADSPVTGCILHPSPASPAANRGWAEKVTAQLIELGVW